LLGAVRWAGAGLNTRKIILDLTRTSSHPTQITHWMATNIPVHLMPDVNHGTILSRPTDELVRLVKSALQVSTAKQFQDWLNEADAQKKEVAVAETKGAWQQLIVHCVDQRGDPITDFHLKLYEGDDEVVEFDDERVAVYSRNASYRCFYADAEKLLKRSSLNLKIMALSGSIWIDFQGFGWERPGEVLESPTANERWDATFDLTDALRHDKQVLSEIVSGTRLFDNHRLLAPFTTTLLEIRLDRDAYPLNLAEISNLLKWDASDGQ
jgi:hypothetical protein